MRGSFQDQLLKLGLADKQKAKDVKKEQYTAQKQQTGKEQPPVVDENALLAEAARKKKQERARQLNLEREEKLRKREEEARIRQIIEANIIAQNPQGVAYRFADKGKIFRIFVSEKVVSYLSSGLAAIVRCGEKFEVISREAAEKIRQAQPKLIVYCADKREPTDKTGGDDPYKDFAVPDDLMW